MEKLWSVMDKLGIPEKVVIVIRSCVQWSWCKVKFNNILSNDFEVVTGLRQGDALFQALFNITFIREILLTVKGFKIGNNKQLVMETYPDRPVMFQKMR